MSFAELKEQVAGLSSKDRFRLATFIADLEEQSEAEHHAELNRRMKAMDEGEKVTAEEVEKRHKKLQAQGR